MEFQQNGPTNVLAAPLSLGFGVKDAGLGPQGQIGFVSRYIGAL